MNATLVRGLVLRWIARHRLRSALAVIAVALGVTAFLASVAVTHSVFATGAAATAASAGGADLVVEASGTGLRDEVTAAIRATPGVAACSPLVSGWVRLADGSGSRVLVLGADPAAEAAMTRGAAKPRFEIVDATAFLRGAAGIVARPLADELRIAKGGVVSVQGARGVARIAVAGVSDPPGGSRGPAARTIVVPLSVARAILGRGDLADRIDVSVAPGQDVAAVAARLTAAVVPLAPSARVVRPGEGDASTGEVLGIVDVALKLGALVALLVGVFLVHHTISIGVTERSREVGMLRALGATRRQIVSVFCAEALALGLTGAALGVVLGGLLARTSLDAFASTISGSFFPADAAPIEMPPTLVVSGIVAGALVALIAAWHPAARAAALAPNDAIRRGPETAQRSGGPVTGRTYWSAGLFLLAGALLFAPVPRGSYLSTFALLAAFMVAAPALLVLSATALAPILQRLAGLPGRLAAMELARHPRRAALPAATLAIGLALVVETMGNARSLSDSMSTWIEENIAGDLFISSGGAAVSIAGHTPLDAALFDEIRTTPGVRTLTGVRTFRAPWRGTHLLLLGLDVAHYRPMARVTVHDLVPETAAARDAALALVESGAWCLASENFAALHGIGAGETVELPAPGGTVALRIAGLYPDWSWPRGTLIVDRSVLVRAFDDRVVDEFSVQVAPGGDPPAVARAIEARIGEGRELVVLSSQDLRDAARGMLEDFFKLSYAQIGVAVVVAFLAVFNSLWIAVVTRRREIGLLRAVGATRAQVVASVVLQAAVMGVTGAAFGLIGGLAVQWIAVRRVFLEETGWSPAYVVAWGPVALALVLGAIASAVAGIVPARVAASTEIRDAIGWE